MDDPAGRLHIALRWQGERWRVAITSSRPLRASRIFTGKPLAEVAGLIPRLYSLCATAQSLAFSAALETLESQTAHSNTLAHRACLLYGESIKEHLWRLLLDWPPALALAREEAAMAQVIAAWQRLRGIPDAEPAIHAERAGALLINLVEQTCFGQPAAAWLASCVHVEHWLRWSNTIRTPVARLAQALHDQRLDGLGQGGRARFSQPNLGAIAARLAEPDADAFIAAPEIDGICHETGSLARMREEPLIVSLRQHHGNGMTTRLAAVLCELAHACRALRAPAEHIPAMATLKLTAASSLAAVPAARGLLIHRLVASCGQVVDHQVVAPTEWHFHPRGVLADALAGLPPPAGTSDQAETQRLARLLILAIDPCVDYQMTCA